MSVWIIDVCVFVGVAALVGGVAVVLRGDREDEVDERLSVLTGGNERRQEQRVDHQRDSLDASRDGTQNAFETMLSQLPESQPAVRAGRRRH